jgi:peptidoglycan hydrolase-like protein with peptidoglycan-binding domain
MLSVLSSYIPSIPPVSVDGVYGRNTRAAVLAAQRRFSLPETGTVGAQTWDAIYDQFSGIENTSLRNAEVFPTGNRYNRSTTMTQFPGRDLSAGSRDIVRKEVIR